jgi:carbonic anhydrase
VNILSRRNIIRIGAGAVGTGVIASCAQRKEVASSQDASSVAANSTESGSVSAAAPSPNNPNATPDQALQQLVDGNQRFVTNKRQNPNQTMARVTEIAKGQKPFAAILGCADSRVPAEILFDQGFGDLFVCRVAGNVATPEEIGSLEFGCAVLGSKTILVMGHERCGAVEASIKGAPVPGQISSLLEAIKPAVESTKGESGDRLESTCKANVKRQVETLLASPVLSQLVKDGKLKIAGGYYDLDTSQVTLI